jgi:hypothetical protein
MGYDASAVVIAGIPLFKADLYVEKELLNCIHEFTSPCCPECGAKRGTHTEKICLAGDDDFEVFFRPFDMTYTDMDCNEFILGVRSSNVDTYHKVRPLQIPDPEVVKVKLRAKLEPLGLWDEKKFNLLAKEIPYL